MPTTTPLVAHIDWIGLYRGYSRSCRRCKTNLKNEPCRSSPLFLGIWFPLASATCSVLSFWVRQSRGKERKWLSQGRKSAAEYDAFPGRSFRLMRKQSCHPRTKHVSIHMHNAYLVFLSAFPSFFLSSHEGMRCGCAFASRFEGAE